MGNYIIVPSDKTRDDIIARHERQESDIINTLRNRGEYRDAYARVSVLRDAGWKMTDIADAAGCTRAAVSTWRRGDEITDAEFERAASLGDVLVYRKSPAWSRIMESEDAVEVLLEHMHSDNFAVPTPLVSRLEMLARFAYLSRPAHAENDYSIASEVLDMVVCTLHRRGVTSYAMAQACGVTTKVILGRAARESCPDFLSLTVRPSDEYFAVRLSAVDTRVIVNVSYRPVTGDSELMSNWVSSGMPIAQTEKQLVDIHQRVLDGEEIFFLVHGSLVSFTGLETQADVISVNELLPKSVFKSAARSEVITALLTNPDTVADIAPVIKKHSPEAKTRRENREVA